MKTKQFLMVIQNMLTDKIKNKKTEHGMCVNGEPEQIAIWTMMIAPKPIA